MRIGNVVMGTVAAAGAMAALTSIGLTPAIASARPSATTRLAPGSAHRHGHAAKRHPDRMRAPAADTAGLAADARAEAVMVDRLTHQPVRQVYTFYTVRPGDTVARIAKRFHDVAWLLRRRNGGLWNMGPGQQIRVLQWPFGTPYFAVRPYVTDRPQSYDVRPGDTLSAIAARMHTDPLTLSGQNGLGDGSIIYAGQRLVLHHYATHLHRTLVPGVPAERLHTGLLLTDVANLTGVDAALVKGLAWRETQWTMVRGASGEIGMMQIMPFMARWVQRALVGYDLDPNVPVNNALEGTLLLDYYLDRTGRNAHKALALYHSGDTFASHRNGLYISKIDEFRDYFYHHPRAGF